MSIKLNTSAVIGAAAQIEKNAAEFMEALSETQETMKCLSRAWTSDASDVFFEKYNVLKKNAASGCGDVMRNYAKFLRAAVDDGYVPLETQIKKNASAFSER